MTTKASKTTKRLPAQPSLEQLRRQAKELIRAFRAGDPSARERILSQLRGRTEDVADGKASASLSFAQFTVAREYGFESWPRLKFFIDSLEMTFEEKLKAFVAAATTNRLYYAQFLLQNEPRLASHDLSTACLMGDVERVRKLLLQTPSLISTKTGLKNWEPLMYVCFSFFNKEGKEASQKLLKTAELLIHHGANTNTFYLHQVNSESANHQVPALYGPSGATNFPELADLLLRSGAQPDERESLYHSAEFKDKTCMKLLLKYGAHPTQWGALHHSLDFANDQGYEILLQAGADPNFQYLDLGSALHHAVIRGRNDQVIQTLLQYGADPSALNPQGKTPYEMALRFGNIEAQQILQTKSAQRPQTINEEFIAACAAADANAAKTILKSKPDLIKHLPEEDLRLIADFATLNKKDSVALMLDLGFNLNQRGPWGGPILHQAVWHGHLELVELLIQKGADLESLNGYQGTALDAIIFASSFQEIPIPADQCIQIAEVLLEAGAKIHPAMLTKGSETMSEFLKTYVIN